LAQTDSALSSAETATTLMFFLGAVVVVIGVLVLVGLRRLVTAPVTSLANQVREVAAGDYDRKLSAAGAPELVRLADDVDAMRARIAADLHEADMARQRQEEAYAELRRLNAELELRAAELGRSNRDLEQFAYVASHDLQEPLRKVASFCQLLQRRYAGQLDEKADQYITFAVDGAQRMQQLINDLLAFSRIGRGTGGFVEIDLGDLIRDTVADLEYPIKQSRGEVVVGDLPVLRGEPALLSALVTNLVGNAMKFRRPDVVPRVEFCAERDGDYWRITCSDNGIGIDTEYAEKVFVIFQRLQPRDQYAGTGIGLAIAKKIVEYHGGEIWVNDRPAGAGASISFTLPVDLTAAEITPISPGRSGAVAASLNAPAEGDAAEQDAAADDRAEREDAGRHGAEHDGAEHDGTKHDGTKHDGTEHDGTEHDGTELDGTQPGPVQSPGEPESGQRTTPDFAALNGAKPRPDHAAEQAPPTELRAGQQA